MTSQNLFDRETLNRQARESIDQTFKAAHAMHHQLQHLADWQREQINQIAERNLEIFNQACNEIEKNSRRMIERVDETCRQMMDRWIETIERTTTPNQEQQA